MAFGHFRGIFSKLLHGLAQRPLNQHGCPVILRQVFSQVRISIQLPLHIRRVQSGTHLHVIACRIHPHLHPVDIMLVHTVLRQVFQFLAGISLALLQALLALGQRSPFVRIDRLVAPQGSDTGIDITLRGEQRVGTRQFAVQDVGTDLPVVVVQLVIVDAGIVFHHLGYQLFACLLLGIKFLQAGAILLLRDAVFLAQLLYLVFALHQLALQVAANFPFVGQLVIRLPAGSFQHQYQRVVLGIGVLPRQGFRVHQRIAVLADRLQGILLPGHGEGERAFVVTQHSRTTFHFYGHTLQQRAGRHRAVAVQTTFRLGHPLLGLGIGHERYHPS